MSNRFCLFETKKEFLENTDKYDDTSIVIIANPPEIHAQGKVIKGVDFDINDYFTKDEIEDKIGNVTVDDAEHTVYEINDTECILSYFCINVNMYHDNIQIYKYNINDYLNLRDKVKAGDILVTKNESDIKVQVVFVADKYADSFVRLVCMASTYSYFGYIDIYADKVVTSSVRMYNAYSAGTGIEIDDNGVISCTVDAQNKYIAGTNIDITPEQVGFNEYKYVISSTVNLSNYYNKTEIDDKISDVNSQISDGYSFEAYNLNQDCNNFTKVDQGQIPPDKLIFDNENDFINNIRYASYYNHNNQWCYIGKTVRADEIIFISSYKTGNTLSIDGYSGKVEFEILKDISNSDINGYVVKAKLDKVVKFDKFMFRYFYSTYNNGNVFPIGLVNTGGLQTQMVNIKNEINNDIQTLRDEIAELPNTTEVDLSDYYTKSEIDDSLSEIDDALNVINGVTVYNAYEFVGEDSIEDSYLSPINDCNSIEEFANYVRTHFANSTETKHSYGWNEGWFELHQVIETNKLYCVVPVNDGFEFHFQDINEGQDICGYNYDVYEFIGDYRIVRIDFERMVKMHCFIISEFTGYQKADGNWVYPLFVICDKPKIEDSINNQLLDIRNRMNDMNYNINNMFNYWIGTQEEYDAIGEKDSNIFYFIKEDEE